MAITLCGTSFAIITGTMPQWSEEKWPSAKLTNDKITCLTRGNGHRHIMVFIGISGSWDLEKMATGRPLTRSETRGIATVLPILWTCLLISVSGIKSHTWYLIGIGGMGMLQNLFAAATPRSSATANVHTTKFYRAPTIIGRWQPCDNDTDTKQDPEVAEDSLAAVRCMGLRVAENFSWCSLQSSYASMAGLHVHRRRYAVMVATYQATAECSHLVCTKRTVGCLLWSYPS